MQNNTVTQLNLPASKVQTLEPHFGKSNGASHEADFGQHRFGSELVAISQPYSPQVEALRVLRGQLMMRWFDDEHRSLAIVSARSGEGCSYLAANLAVIFAQLGQRTLLVDANLRDPRQHLIFKLKANIGLSDILAGRADLGAATQLESVENLSVLSAGAAASNPLELLSRASFKAIMKQAVVQYDVVLVDTTPVTMTADAQATVAHCGSALLVSRLNHTKFSDLTEMRDQIAITGAQIVGSVINDF
jgi:protein-tyrosine kinase